MMSEPIVFSKPFGFGRREWDYDKIKAVLDADLFLKEKWCSNIGITMDDERAVYDWPWDFQTFYAGFSCSRSALQSAREEIAQFEKLSAAMGKLHGKLLAERDTLKAEAARMREMYKECFEMYIPTNKWDEATMFLSTYGNDLARDIARREGMGHLLPPAAPEKAETCLWSKKNMMNGEKYTGSCGYTIFHPDYEGVFEKNCPGCGKPIAEGGEG